jgi:hypothetical protein
MRIFGMRTRISSRILKPRGRSSSTSTADRRTRKQPLMGSVTCQSLVGNIITAARVETCDNADRARLNLPVLPPAQNRLATTMSEAVSSASVYMSSSSSGGCWRSASMTQTYSPRAARMPATTAPPSPPLRSSGLRWIR